MNFRNIFRPCVLYKISSSYIPAFIQNGNQMKLIVLVFKIVDGTPINWHASQTTFKFDTV